LNSRALFFIATTLFLFEKAQSLLRIACSQTVFSTSLSDKIRSLSARARAFSFKAMF